MNDSKKLPKTLPMCLDSFCSACLERCFNSSLSDQESIFKCPICQKKQTSVNSLNDIPVKTEILRIVEKRYNNPKPNQIYHAAR